MAKVSNSRGQDQTDPLPDSQEQVKALHEFFKGPKGDDQELGKFQEQVEADQKELKALLQRRLRETQENSRRRREEILELLARGLQPSIVENGKSDGVEDDGDNSSLAIHHGTRIERNGVKDTAAEVIRKSKSLIKDYDDMEAMLNKVRDEQQKKLAAENWESEVRETERLLLLGRNRAVRCVGRVVDVAEKDKGYVEDGDGDKTENGGDEAVEDDDGDADMGLLRTLEYAERGVKRMVKGIPREDEEDEDVK